jgi:phage/plasmid-like protein (TIGR03299 family)
MHAIDMSNDRANIAFVGNVPWHGLGQPLSPDASLEDWQREAGMGWNVSKRPVLYEPGTNTLEEFPERVVLVRDDTAAPLSIVSKNYHVVQPREVLEFYRDLIQKAGFRMHTAGVLFGGCKVWALADIGQRIDVGYGDEVNGFLLLATSYDGSLSTTAQFTTVRVVCNNTLSLSVARGERDDEPCIRIPHNTRFDSDRVKAELGLAPALYATFEQEARALAAGSISDPEAVQWLVRVLGDPTKPAAEQTDAPTIKSVFTLWKGDGRGAFLKTARQTVWGLVNAVTQFVDHERRSTSVDNRLNAAWFGKGATIKHKAWAEAVTLVQGKLTLVK